MLKSTPLLLAATLLAAACSSSDSEAGSGEPPKAPASAAVDTPPAGDDTVVPYSAEAADQALTALAACTSQGFCDAFQQLVSYGDRSTEGLLVLAGDPSKGMARRVAVEALVEIDDAKAAMPLFEMAKKEEDTLLRGTLYEASAKLGDDDEMFAAMTALFQDPPSKDHERGVRKGLVVFGERTFTWAAEQMPTAKKPTRYADLVTETATEETSAQLGALLDGCKDPMVCHRLASKAIALGDHARFEVLLAGLAAKDEYDRADAGNMFARVADETPQDLRPKAIELLKSARERDKGGLTSRGYDKSLKALGAE